MIALRIALLAFVVAVAIGVMYLLWLRIERIENAMSQRFYQPDQHRNHQQPKRTPRIVVTRIEQKREKRRKGRDFGSPR